MLDQADEIGELVMLVKNGELAVKTHAFTVRPASVGLALSAFVVGHICGWVGCCGERCEVVARLGSKECRECGKVERRMIGSRVGTSGLKGELPQ